MSIASAQSSVTLYGSIDAGFADVESRSSIAGLNSSASGIGGSNMTTSRWGIRGTEELGGGLSAFFNLESQIVPGSGDNAGSENAMFQRRSVVGLQGNFGTVTIGRDFTPLYHVLGAGDIFSTTGATTVNLNPTGTRTDNMVSYETPTFGGFSAKAMVGENKASSDSATPATNTKNRTTGFSGKYANGPLMVTAGWGENTGATSDSGAAIGTLTKDFTDNTSKQEGSAISATYDFTVAKLFTNYTQGKFTSVNAGVPVLKSEEFNLGVTVPVGAFTLMAAYGYNDVTQGADSGDGHDYVLGAVYALSKRTSMYVKTGTYNKVSGNIGGVREDFKTTATAVGLRHSF